MYSIETPESRLSTSNASYFENEVFIDVAFTTPPNMLIFLTQAGFKERSAARVPSSFYAPYVFHVKRTKMSETASQKDPLPTFTVERTNKEKKSKNKSGFLSSLIPEQVFSFPFLPKAFLVLLVCVFLCWRCEGISVVPVIPTDNRSPTNTAPDDRPVLPQSGKQR